MEVVKKLRVRIDALIQSAKTAICSAETTLAYRELQLAKAWLGKSLGYLGNATPYPAVDSIDKIPPTTEVSELPFQLPGDPHQNANALRGEIEAVIGQVQANMPTEARQYQCFMECWVRLNDAKFWYGYEIGRIRDTPKVVPAHLSQQPLTVNEAKMDAITNTDAPEPPTEAEQTEVDEAFEKPQPFVVEKVASNATKVDLEWNGAGTEVNIKANPSGKYLMGIDPYEENGDGSILYPDGSTSKILENEDQGSQEKQSRTSKKKG